MGGSIGGPGPMTKTELLRYRENARPQGAKCGLLQVPPPLRVHCCTVPNHFKCWYLRLRGRLHDRDLYRCYCGKVFQCGDWLSATWFEKSIECWLEAGGIE